jgi:hypothetical protein
MTGSTDRPTEADTNGTTDPDVGTGRYSGRIRTLAERARDERRSFDPPANLPAEQRALSYLREGFGPTVMVYVEARTGGRLVRFTEREHGLLHRAVNDWLHLYARCYGVEVDPDATVRTAAEALLETHNVRDTAQLLTCVPER